MPISLSLAHPNAQNFLKSRIDCIEVASCTCVFRAMLLDKGCFLLREC